MQNSPKVTFYKHEVVGARQTEQKMHRLGFEEEKIQKVSKLVRMHQFRFYSDTSDKAIKKWMQTLGKQGWIDMIHVRLADRAGNLKNKDKPVIYKELYELMARANKMIKNQQIVFEEDLQVKRMDFYRYGVPEEKHNELMANLLGMVMVDKKKNQKHILVEYIKKYYSSRSQYSGNKSVNSSS